MVPEQCLKALGIQNLSKQTANNLKKLFSSERDPQGSVLEIALLFASIPFTYPLPSKILFLLLTVVILQVSSG